MTDNPTACLLVIGNEVLSGRTRDANIQFIAGKLGGIGMKLLEVRVIPDIAEVIVRTLNEVRARFDHVFTTGGIGPTHDDITSECVAAAFGVPWVPHPEAFAEMMARYPEGEFNIARQRMATMPRGATLIRNEESFAPGFTIGNVHVMAGVPRIMQSMMNSLLSTLPRGAEIYSRAVHATGLLEGVIAAPLSDIQDRYAALDIGSYPYDRPDSRGVAIVVKGIDPHALDGAVDEVAKLMTALGYVRFWANRRLRVRQGRQCGVFVRCMKRQRQRMQPGGKLSSERVVRCTSAADSRLSLKSGGNQSHTKVRFAPGPCSGMASMTLAFVNDFQDRGCETRRETIGDASCSVHQPDLAAPGQHANPGAPFPNRRRGRTYRS